MDNSIQIFNYQDSREVRVIEQDGEPWFVAKYVCEILGIQNPRDAIAKSLDDDERGVSEISTPSNGGYSKVNIISESGLYTLIMRSNKPEAKQFRRWVTHEVLPDIRKHGMYLNEKAREAALNDPEEFNAVARAYALEKEKVKVLQSEIEKNMGYLVLGKAVAPLAGYVTFADAAQMLYENYGKETGRNRLYKYGREKGYLSKQKGRYNKPTQKGVKSGFASVSLDPEHFRFATRTMISVKAMEQLGREFFADAFPLLAPLMEMEDAV